MDGISRSRGWDKEIPHGVLPMEQLVLSDKWARKRNPRGGGGGGCSDIFIYM